MIAWTLFTNPLPVEASHWALWLMLPLLLSVAIVYKTIRTEHICRLPVEIAKLMAYMLAGLTALAAVILVILKVFL